MQRPGGQQGRPSAFQGGKGQPAALQAGAPPMLQAGAPEPPLTKIPYRAIFKHGMRQYPEYSKVDGNWKLMNPEVKKHDYCWRGLQFKNEITPGALCDG